MPLSERDPLAEWAALPDFRAPDPASQSARGALDWESVARSLAGRREPAEHTAGSLEHGFLFMRLYYLRGFENLMLVCGVYPPTPPENVDAVCCALEEFREYWR